MHPPLFKDHPDCKEVVQALVRCHEEHNVGKFFGACNDAKAALDKCFKAEKDVKRRLNMERAKETEKEFQKVMADFDAKKKA